MNLVHLILFPNQHQFKLCRTEMDITKAPLILGFNSSCSLGVPLCMTTDVMHLAGNLSKLLISLWQGLITCASTDDIATWDWAVLHDEATWQAYGRAVEEAGIYLPRSFDMKPCNLAEKMNTGYKTWEFQLYLFDLAPALLHSLFPD